MLSVAAAAEDDFLYGSSPGTDTDGLTSVPPTQGSAAARVWTSGYQDPDQVCIHTRVIMRFWDL